MHACTAPTSFSPATTILQEPQQQPSMSSFLNLLRGSQPAFVPEREIRNPPARSAKLTVNDLRKSLRFPDLLPVSHLSTEAERLQARISALEGELHKVGEHISQGRVTLDEYKNKVRLLEVKIWDLEDAKAIAEKEQGKFEDRLKVVQQEKRELEDECDRLREQLEASSQREADLQKRIDATTPKVEELGRLQSTHAELIEGKDAADLRVHSLEGMLATVQAENTALKDSVKAKDAQILKEQSKLGEAMALLRQEKEKAEALEAQVAQLKRQLADKETFYTLEIDALTLARDMYESQEQEALAKCDDEHKGRVSAEAMRDSIQTERDLGLIRVSGLEIIVASQHQQILTLEEQLDAERTRGDDLLAQKEKYLEQLKALMDALGTAQEEQHHAKETAKKLRKDLRDTQKALDEVQAAVSVATSSDEQLQERIVVAEKQNRELQASKKALQDALFDSVQRCEATRDELFLLRNSSKDSLVTPDSPSPLPFGSSLFNVAPQLEAASPPPPPKRSSFHRFFSRQVDENANASTRSPVLA